MGFQGQEGAEVPEETQEGGGKGEEGEGAEAPRDEAEVGGEGEGAEDDNDEDREREEEEGELERGCQGSVGFKFRCLATTPEGERVFSFCCFCDFETFRF